MRLSCTPFITALGANASDLWHHLVYRLYCEILPESRHQDPGQSWVRASGDALEIALEKIYSAVLAPHNITIVALISRQSAKAVLKEIGLENKVGDSNLIWCFGYRLPSGCGRFSVACTSRRAAQSGFQMMFLAVGQ